MGVNVYLIRSADSGATWSVPIRINQDLPSPNRQHFFPWITCDPVNGNLSVIFYDDRDTPSNQVETWVATSTDGGENWQDFRVSDVAFTPAPVTGQADNYFGDYLGITARNGRVYPCWTDNRTGTAMTYVSPFRLGPDPGQPFIAYQANQYNDSEMGNGNGLPEYDESAKLGLSIRNMGDISDTLVTITLRSLSPFLTFSDSTGFLESIQAGAMVTLQDEFALHIADSVPDGEKMVIQTLVRDASDSLFVSYFTLKASAPAILIQDFIVRDTTSNNNHSLDPAEQAEILIRLDNPTIYPATDLVCSLESLQDFVHVTPASVAIGDLGGGETGYAVFQVSVDTVTAGTPASFRVRAVFSEQQKERIFNKKIGLIFEDWESGDFSKFKWVNGAPNPWTIDSIYRFEGRFSARSREIKDSAFSVLTISGRALTYDSISFYRKVSSEERWDFLNFYIDGKRVGQWSGELDWQRVVFPVLPGAHIFKWEYVKDKGVSIGLDAAFIDFVEFPSIQYTTADAGKDATIFECQKFACNGIATYYDSIRWSTSGTGYFGDPQNMQTGYFPSEADKEAGVVILILTAYGSVTNDLAVDSLILTILPMPTAYAGVDNGICRGDDFQVMNASAANYTNLLWQSTGDGYFSDSTILMPLYYPGNSDTTAGYVNLILNSYSGLVENCNLAKDTVHIAIYRLPAIPLQEDYTACTGYSVKLDATIPNGSSYLWSDSLTHTSIIVVDSTGTGEGSVNYSVQVTDEHGCSSTASANVTFISCSEKHNAGNVFFRLFPNPSKEETILEYFTAESKTIRYRITSETGQIMKESVDMDIQGLGRIPVSVSNLAQGTYFFSIINGEDLETIPLIVL
jgi:hypothetical protein